MALLGLHHIHPTMRQAAIAALLLLAAVAVSVSGVPVGPQLLDGAACAAVSTTDGRLTDTIPVLGLSANTASRQCLKVDASPAAQGGLISMDLSLDLTGLEAKVRAVTPASSQTPSTNKFAVGFAIWNIERRVDPQYTTSVSFSSPSTGIRAYGIPIIDGNGKITGVTITQPGKGYTSAPTVTFTRGPTTSTTAAAVAIAVLSATGSVANVVVRASTTGWIAGSPVYDSDSITEAKLETWVQPTSISSTNDPSLAVVDSYDYGFIKDTTRCDCSIPASSACTCVPYGRLSDTYTLVSCTAPIKIHISLTNSLAFGIAAFLLPVGDDVVPRLSYGVPGTFVTPLGGVSTDIRLQLNSSTAVDPARRWLKEMRVTMTTPLEENWFCRTSGLPETQTDCGARDFTISRVVTDLSALPIYNMQSPSHLLGFFSPPTRGVIATNGVTVSAQGSGYPSRPTVSIAGNAAGIVLASISVLDGGAGYTVPPTITITGGGPSTPSSGWVAALGSDGAITSITGGLAGAGFVSTPEVRITPLTTVQQVYITGCGSNYDTANLPSVALSDDFGAGTLATCTPTVVGGAITACTVTTEGSGYTPGVTVGVAFYARLLSVSTTSSSSCSICTPGSTFVGNTGISFSFSGGSQVTAPVFTYSVTGGALTISITSGGLWFSTGTLVYFTQTATGAQAIAQATFTPGSGASGRALAVAKVTRNALAMAVLSPSRPSYDSTYFNSPQTTRPAVAIARMSVENCDGTGSGSVVGVDVIDPGAGFPASGATVTFSFEGETSSATATVAINTGADASVGAVSIDSAGLITGVTIANGGSGYSTPPTLQFMYRRRVISIALTNTGYQYSAVPFVTITGPTGTVPWGNAASAATATAEWSSTTKKLTSITVTDQGWGYITVPTVTIIPRYEIQSIRICNPGTGYTSVPAVCITGGGGRGAKATAILSGSVITGITITDGGYGYTSWPTVTLVGGGYTTIATVQSTSLYITLGTGGGALAIAKIERGDGALATTTIASGVVTGVSIVRGGPIQDPRRLSTDSRPYLTSGSDTAFFQQQFAANGLPTDQVDVRHPSINLWGSPPTLLSSFQYRRSKDDVSVSGGVTHKVFLGASYALSSMLVLSTGASIGASTTSDLQPGTKVWSFYDLAPATLNTNPYYKLEMYSPEGGDSVYFPTLDFSANTVAGSSEIGALFLAPTVKVEFFEYTNVNGLWQSGSLAYGQTQRFQVNLNHWQWSKINFTYNATGMGQEASLLQIRYSHPQIGSGAWQNYNPATGIRRSNLGQLLVPLPNVDAVPLVIEISLAGCTVATTTTFNFNIQARVWDFKDEGGECNSYLDCRRERGHPTPSSRLGLSANQDAGRFRDCMVGRTGYTGFCVECTDGNACGCNPGQYCHTDPGTCSIGGVPFSCDKESERKFGTCQQKDNDQNIFYSQCVENVAASAVYTGETVGFCGKSLYYNASYVDPNQNNRLNGSRRVDLWTGSCVAHQCLECADGLTACGGRRFCADGFWTHASGYNYGVGKVQSENTEAVQNEVYRNSQINASFLAFAIIITVLLCVAVGMSLRKS